MHLRPLDVVRITQLITPTRPIDGTPGALRQPRVGDVGAIVNVLDAQTFTVECVDAAGLTSWLADFRLEELEKP